MDKLPWKRRYCPNCEVVVKGIDYIDEWECSNCEVKHRILPLRYTLEYEPPKF